MKVRSTTALAKEMKLQPGELFDKLEHLGWIIPSKDYYELTPLGKQKGGCVKQSRHGEYIAWPESLKDDLAKVDVPGLKTQVLGVFSKVWGAFTSVNASKILSLDVLAKQLNVSTLEIKQALSELSWIESGAEGWNLTALGKQKGGQQKGPTLVWMASLLDNDLFISQLHKTKKTKQKPTQLKEPVAHYGKAQDFWSKFPASIRTQDGHMVRSRAEKMIDDFLYTARIVHAYEKRLPIDESVYCDFYLPDVEVYIEFWGLEDDATYVQRKQEKIALYKKYGLQLLELRDADLQNLEATLAAKLRAYGLKVLNF